MDSVSEFNAKADILMERLRSLADGKTVVRLFKELNHTTFDAIAAVYCRILRHSVAKLDYVNFFSFRLLLDYTRTVSTIQRTEN